MDIYSMLKEDTRKEVDDKIKNNETFDIFTLYLFDIEDEPASERIKLCEQFLDQGYIWHAEMIMIGIYDIMVDRTKKMERVPPKDRMEARRVYIKIGQTGINSSFEAAKIYYEKGEYDKGDMQLWDAQRYSRVFDVPLTQEQHAFSLEMSMKGLERLIENKL
jgi:hypothetical protein